MLKKLARGLLEKEIIPPARDPHVSLDHLIQTSYEPLFSPPISPKEEIPDIVIGENTVVKGSLSFPSLLHVDGTFEGELSSSGKVIIGPTGTVKSDLYIKEACIAGNVEGNITVSGKLTLQGNASIKGDITAAMLSVEEGVSIEGRLHISQTLNLEEDDAETKIL